MGTFDVTLPVSQPPVFPPRCVVCEAENPNELVDLSFLGGNLWGNTTNKVNGVPACKGCASGLRRYHRWLKVSYYILPLVGVILAFVLKVPIFVRILIAIGFAVGPGILSLIFPPSFGLTLTGGAANFEFKSKVVADEFAERNSEV